MSKKIVWSLGRGFDSFHGLYTADIFERGEKDDIQKLVEQENVVHFNNINRKKSNFYFVQCLYTY